MVHQTAGDDRHEPVDATPTQVVFVGQLPPPVHGQAVWNRAVADGRYNNVELTVVPMRFSDEVATVGRFRFAKLWRIPGLIWRVARAAGSGHRDVLFYAVGAKNRVAILRDISLLPIIRPWFHRTVFYVHTGDIRSLYERPVLRRLARCAYGRADLVIHSDRRTAGPMDQLPDPAALAYLPHGVADPRERHEAAGLRQRPAHAVPVIVFVGNLFVAKGTHHVVRACGLLAAKGLKFEVRFAGAAPNPTAVEELRALIERCDVADQATVLGPLDRDGVWELLEDADIFCFPTRYEAENMPLVVIEAMACGLPVLSTWWRGVPALVADGETGFLVEPDDDEALADRLARLLEDPELMAAMGGAGRRRYEANHDLAVFESRLEAMLRSAAGH